VSLDQKDHVGFDAKIQVDDFACIEQLINHPLKYVVIKRDFRVNIDGIFESNQSKQLVKKAKHCRPKI
jgi:hypothetical protein